MGQKPNNQLLTGGHSNLSLRRSHSGKRQPFLLPALGFYVLSAAIALIIFFLVWGILHDGTEGETPWVPAGILGGLFIAGAVVLREVVLRKRRYNLLLAQERLDHNLKNVYRQKQISEDENKLTLEKNSLILEEIGKKSQAANVLGNLTEGHLEVFELCNEYLHRSGRELESVRPGSPRIKALTRGREKVQLMHKFHLLAWSSGESRALIQEAKSSATISKKLDFAAKALNILESAAEFYPEEKQFIDSVTAVKEFITNIKVSHWIEQAERAAFKRNYKQAINHYQDALFYFQRENAESPGSEAIREKINLEIEKIKNITNEEQNAKPLKGKGSAKKND